MQQRTEPCREGTHQFVAVATQNGAYLVCKQCEQRVPVPSDGSAPSGAR